MLMPRRFDPAAGVGRSVPASVNRQHPHQRARTHWEEKEMDQQRKKQGGFTLIELLIAIVVVGILAAVAIVGIGGLTTTGNTAACKASADSATAASAAFYANNANVWQANLAALQAATPAVWQTPNNTLPVGNVLKFGTWTLTESGGGAIQPTFVCT
jgi:prepilin-type N-terminal cleavage/methylation domain-containing protein